jgi:hypothetical protein
MACQLFFDGVRGSISLDTAIHFDPSWIPPPIKCVEKVDQDQLFQAKPGAWARWDERLLGVDCGSSVPDEGAPGYNASEITQ